MCLTLLSTEQEQDAAMERHRWEQELKRKRDALSLEEIKDQLVALERRLKSLREEKNELFLQLKRVLNEDEKRKKQKEAELLEAHRQAMSAASQQLSYPFSGYPHYLPSSSLVVAARPSAIPPPSSNDTYRQGTPPMKSATNAIKRRHEGSPSPTPPPRPQSSSGKQAQQINHPKTAVSSAYHFYYPPGVPTTVAFDLKGNPYALSYSDGLTQRELAEYEARHLRSLPPGSSQLIPIQPLNSSSVKTGGITSGFPVRSSPASTSSILPGNALSRPDLKNDNLHGRPPSQPQNYPRNFY